MRWTMVKYVVLVNVTGSLVFIREVAADKSQKIHSERMMQKLNCWFFSYALAQWAKT